MLKPSGNFIVDLDDSGLADAIHSGLAEVEAQLREAVVHADDFITDVSQHLIKAGGKRFRPFLTLLAARFGDLTADSGATGASPYRPGVIQAAVGIELIHLGSLHHDDVLDEASIRRGAPSVNARWSNRIAILSGDYLFAQASRIFGQLGLEAVQIQSEITGRLITGQLQETHGVERAEDPIQRYLDVIGDKTGALISACGTLGALLSDAPSDSVKALGEYGEAIGVAFQISDDLLDIVAEPKGFGKTAGTDLREGVRTLPVLYALTNDNPAEARLRELIARPLSDEAEHTEALELLRVSASIDQAYRMLKTYATQARTLLAPLPETPARAALESLADFVVTRTK